MLIYFVNELLQLVVGVVLGHAMLLLLPKLAGFFCVSPAVQFQAAALKEESALVLLFQVN